MVCLILPKYLTKTIVSSVYCVLLQYRGWTKSKREQKLSTKIRCKHIVFSPCCRHPTDRYYVLCTTNTSHRDSILSFYMEYVQYTNKTLEWISKCQLSNHFFFQELISNYLVFNFQMSRGWGEKMRLAQKYIRHK